MIIMIIIIIVIITIIILFFMIVKNLWTGHREEEHEGQGQRLDTCDPGAALRGRSRKWALLEPAR